MYAADPTAPPLKIRLFGPFDAWANGAPLPRLRTRKGQWLLALLTLRHGREVERSWLAGTLWPDSDEARAHHSLRMALSDLRRGLGAEARRILAPTSAVLRLDATGAEVDVILFDAAIERPDPAALEEAVRQYRGPLLEGCDGEWVFPERQAREEAYLGALERLAEGAMAAARPEAAAGYLRRVAAVDPLREGAQRALIAALTAEGSYAVATEVYHEFRRRLRRELNAEPSSETRELFERLRSEARARAVPGGPRSAMPRPQIAPERQASDPELEIGPTGNLPQPWSAFVGRERELQEIGACLASARLVTLTGPGGIGKTRLAIHVADEHAGDMSRKPRTRFAGTPPAPRFASPPSRAPGADGVWFVDLAALSDPARVPEAVARALRVPEAAGAPLMETVQAALGPRHLLLVLDNCEQLIDACARLADALLSGCPHLRILATSRQPLGLPGEIAWRVPSLSLPDSDSPALSASSVPRAIGDGMPPAAGPRAAHRSDIPAPQPPDHRAPEFAWMASEAVLLFVNRAQGAMPGFALTEQNATTVAQVCWRLDGIPLAIELAAARLRVLSLEQIAARLDDRFRLLTGGSRTALPRQQTLRATMDWSYDLLTEGERTLLRRLAVFAGGFTLEAAEAVVSGQWSVVSRESSTTSGVDLNRVELTTDHCLLPTDVLDLLTQLVDRSLVGIERREGVVRYALLETTREYARERLEEAGEGEERRQRHAQFFLAMAERGASELRGAAQVEWLQRLEEEHDNIRAALDGCLKAVVSGQWSVVSPDRSAPTADLPLSELTTDHWPLTTAAEIGLRLAGALGWFWWMRGYLTEGRERLQTLLGQAGGEVRPDQSPQGVGPPETHPPALRLARAKALNGAGMLADDQGDYAAARALFEESLAISRELDDAAGAAIALNNLGGQALQARDYRAARALYEESLALWRAMDEPWWTATLLTNLGRVASQQGEYATARALTENGLAIQRQLGDRRAISRSLTRLGIIAARHGDLEAAQALQAESLALARELGARQTIEETLCVLGSLASERGDHEAALGFHEERLALAREMGSLWGIAESLYYLGLLAREREDESRARALWSESVGVSERLGDMNRIAECLEAVASPAARHAAIQPGLAERGSPESGEGRENTRRAARLFGAAAGLRERVGASMALQRRPEYERQVAVVRIVLDETAFGAAWEEGRAMTLEQAVREAGLTPPPPPR